METAFDATIVGGGNIETGLAGDNLASSVFAGDLIDVVNIPAILAIGDITPERSGATTT